MSESPVRVALICGSRLMADTLGASLRDQPEVELLGAAQGAAEGLELLREPGVEVALIDTDLGEDVVAGMIETARAVAPGVCAIPAGTCETEQIVRFIEAGALGYVCRGASFEQTLLALRAARRGEALCTPTVAAAVYARIHELASESRQEVPALPDTLTGRELEVLRLLGGGLRNKEIAGELGVTVSTAKNHVHAVLAKLAVPRRRDAVLMACRAGLVADATPYLGVHGR